MGDHEEANFHKELKDIHFCICGSDEVPFVSSSSYILSSVAFVMGYSMNCGKGSEIKVIQKWWMTV